MAYSENDIQYELRTALGAAYEIIRNLIPPKYWVVYQGSDEMRPITDAMGIDVPHNVAALDSKFYGSMMAKAPWAEYERDRRREVAQAYRNCGQPVPPEYQEQDDVAIQA